ncbi:Uncharacterized protein PCOAH_00052930 [Plasmodium coatneyi]|uniref:Merozoite surface protein 3 n=1 Tax=Plasmodium coatneyi TaxID=208452 RepID=A0A1B1E8T8_9APIC|nr:Uncharacterized protein PCOAH_00052930 [Plasmodium coatneyi]ANQ11189.1 Uncharacterized protein PCOAH_00052930 [Plasmodium coatneyi]
MKHIWSFSLFIFFLNFYMLQHSVVRNEINNVEKPNLRIEHPSHGKNNADMNNGDGDNNGGDNNSGNNPNEQNGNNEETGKTNEDEADLPMEAQKENEKKQIEEIIEKAELFAEEAKMLADLASEASQKVITFLGNMSEGKIASESKMDAILTSKDAERVKDDAMEAAKRAKAAKTVTEANKAMAQAKYAKNIAELAAKFVKKCAIEALKAGGKNSEASEVAKMEIPIPVQSKPKKELKEQDKKKQPPAVPRKPEATPPAKEAIPAGNATKTNAAPAAVQPAPKSKSHSLNEEKSLKEGSAEAEKDQEQGQQAKFECLQQKEMNVFYNVVQFFICKIKALIKF